MRPTTLCFPIDKKGRLLLGRKRRGFGIAKWNGFGGKIESGETFPDCAIRELHEESGLVADPADLELVAFLDFHFQDAPDLDHIGYVYLLHHWQGTVRQTEEMEPQWFGSHELPFEEMWQGDRKWIPLIQQGKMLKGRINFGTDGETVAQMELHETSFSNG